MRALYTRRLRGLVAVLPSDITGEILAASEKMTGLVSKDGYTAPTTRIELREAGQSRPGRTGPPGGAAHGRRIAAFAMMGPKRYSARVVESGQVDGGSNVRIIVLSYL